MELGLKASPVLSHLYHATYKQPVRSFSIACASLCCHVLLRDQCAKELKVVSVIKESRLELGRENYHIETNC